MPRVITIDTNGEGCFVDVPITDTIPEIGSRTDWIPFPAAEYREIEKVTIPPQNEYKGADRYDYYLATYRPFNLVENHLHLFAVPKGKH